MAAISAASGVSAAIPVSASPSFPIDTLPKDVFLLIFDNLSLYELRASVQLNTTWQKRVIEAANCNVRSCLWHFTQLLMQRLAEEVFYKQKALLTKISEDIPSQQCQNLPQLRRHAWRIEERLVSVIMTLDEPVMMSLITSIQPPKLLVDAFALPIAEKKFNNALLLPYNRGKLFNLEKSFLILIMAGKTEETIASVMTISRESLRASVLQILCEVLTNLRRFERAIDLVRSFTCEGNQIEGFQYIALALTRSGDTVGANAAIDLIPSERHQCYAFKNSSDELLKKRDFDGAFAFIKLIPLEKERQASFKAFFNTLLKIKEYVRAIEVVKLFSEEKDQQDAFFKICSLLVGEKDYVNALEVIGLIRDENESADCLRNVSRSLAHDKNFKEAGEVAMMIPEGIHRSYAFRDISAILCMYKLFDEAAKYVSLISDEEVGALALTRVLHKKRKHSGSI